MAGKSWMVYDEEELWRATFSKSTRWMQVCTMDGFLELETLNGLHSRASKTNTWYETFQQLAEPAVSVDAAGNGSEAEAIYDRCKAYLEQLAAEAGAEDDVESSDLAIVLSWVYLALANLYRYTLRDYWKAIEYLLLLLATRTKMATTSDIIDKIRFALCLTVFEWVDGLGESSDHSEREALLVVPLEEAREIVDEWKTLDDAEVSSSLTYMLILGYSKQENHERKSYWDQRLTDLKMQFVLTGEPVLDSLPKDSSTEFQSFSKKTKICIRQIREFGMKAKVATAGGNILTATDCYKKCVAAMAEALDEFPPIAMAKILEWIYSNLGSIYRIDCGDLLEAVKCYTASLLNFHAIRNRVSNKEVIASNIERLKLYIIRILYERAYAKDVSSDDEKLALIAEAVAQARHYLPEKFDGSYSDTDVERFICAQLSQEYQDLGRIGEALFYNEERRMKMDKKSPCACYHEAGMRSAGLQSELGSDLKKASETIIRLKAEFKNRKPADALRSLARLPHISALERAVHCHRCKAGGSKAPKPMADEVRDKALKVEVEWMMDSLECESAQSTEIEKAQELIKWNLEFYEGEKLMKESQIDEAVLCFHKCLEMLSEDNFDDMKSMMGCFLQIGLCHNRMLIREAKSSACPGSDHDECCAAAQYHYHEALYYFRKGLKVAEKRDDIYHMAEFNKHLGLIIFSCRRQRDVLGHDQSSKDGYERLITTVDHFTGAGRNLIRFMYSIRDVDQLWISVLEREDNVSMGAYYLIQRSMFEVVTWHFNQVMEVTSAFIIFATHWNSKALLWAERSHSRTLAFKLTERNMESKNTLSELRQFDMDDLGGAWEGILDSRDACGPGTVMVEYIKSEEADEKFILYCVRQDGVVLMQLQNKPEKDLEALLRKVNDHMSRQKDDSKLQQEELIQILEELYEAFFSPIQGVLDCMEKHHKLVICANKILAGVPFAALRNPNTKEFLIQRHTLICTPSLRILKQCDQRLKFLQSNPLMETTEAALVLGDPAFSREGRDRLPDTEGEADTIGDILGLQNVQVLKGKKALRNEVLDWTQRATTSGKYQALLHLATHGKGPDDGFPEGALQFANPKVKIWPPPVNNTPPKSVDLPKNCDMSNLKIQVSESGASCSDSFKEASSSSTLSTPPLEAKVDQEPAFQRRGISTSGPRRGNIDPCHLTSEEIVKDYEWRMLLVVLSACETARGAVKSEGTLNLARALLISGVPSTVASQWKVDDASAPTLMEGLYRAMVLGMDVASALRASMVAMIKEKYEVHQWAPFVVMGLGTVKLPKQFQASKSSF